MGNSEQKYQYLFGPVPSRRLGRSLGIDLIPFKVCSFDCIYCQLGRTTNKTLERREWVPTADVIAELERWVADGGEADAVTLSGSGEPTLHTGFGEVLAAARRLGPVRTVLLTNGSLLHLPEVREAAALADVVKVTLSASDPAVWNCIHRQAAGLHYAEVIEGLKAFRREFAGEIWLEVMMLGGVNAVEGETRRIAALAAEIRPARVQLNTPVRPPAEDFAYAVDKADLDRLALLFDPPAEVIGEFRAKKSSERAATEEDVLALLRRHPCSAADVAAALGSTEEAVGKVVDGLVGAGRLRSQKVGGVVCYTAVDGEQSEG